MVGCETKVRIGNDERHPSSSTCTNGTTHYFDVNFHEVLQPQQVIHKEFTSYFLSFDWANRFILCHLQTWGLSVPGGTPNSGMNFHIVIWEPNRTSGPIV